VDSILYFRNARLHTTCAIASTLNLYIKFWHRCRGIVCFVGIDFFVYINFIFLLVILFVHFILFLFVSMFLYRKN
jgi:hypothetical protein